MFIIIRLLKSKSRWFFAFLAVLSVTSTLTNFGILFLINIALTHNYNSLIGDLSFPIFLGLITLSFASNVFFQNQMNILTNDIIYDLELSIVEKVRNASYDSFLRMGRERIYAVIGDAEVLGRLPEILIVFLNTSISIVCSLTYLIWVSGLGGVSILTFVAVLFVVFVYRNKGILADLNRVRDQQDTYYSFLRELIDGFKQIRISDARNNILFEQYILPNRTVSKNLRVKTSRNYIINQLSGIFSWYFILGLIIFVLPLIFKFNLTQMATFVTTILFLMGPISGLINVIPFFTRLKISVERIEEINDLLAVDAVNPVKPAAEFVNFKSIRFENIVYRYGQNGAEGFCIKLDDLTITSNEALFLVGGNGSGKTTFINFLTGLCKPESGSIFLNEQRISWDDFRSFSNQMAVIYTDHYLFKENYDNHDFDKNEIKEFKDLFNVQDIFKVDDHSKSINTKLSKGQQKRIALLMAMLEDKPIIVLDEWAAEQDTLNRNLFYTKWLAELKRRGKTVILISHDNDCFGQADRLVKFEFGKIVSDVYSNQSVLIN